MTIGGNPAIPPATALAVDTTPWSARVRQVAAQLRAAGRRSAAVDAPGQALVAYWGLLVEAGLSERQALFQELQRVAPGDTATPRLWLPVALGEPDFDLACAATRAFVGGWPASVTRREQAVADVVDWILRGLALNRAAAFHALLELADDTLLERLAGLRSRLAVHEAEAVIAACARSGHGERIAFAAEWRVLLDAPLSSTPTATAAA